MSDPVTDPVDQDPVCPESALDLKIRQFETDVDLTHQIVHGDTQTVVTTEGGPLPSLARLLSLREQVILQQWEEILHSMQGTVAKKYQFEKSIVWHVVHNLNCIDFTASIRTLTGQRLYTHIETLNTDELLVHFTEPEEGVISLVFFKDPPIIDTV